MTDEDLALLERYETRVRRGFPIGEVKSELFEKGFTEEQANNFMTELYRLSVKKSDARGFIFRTIISTLFILFGFFLLSTKSMSGVWFIISGVIKFMYDQYFSKKEEL